jgi:ceramide glucosyltransferase
MTALAHILGWIFVALGLAGAAYAVMAAVFARRFASRDEGDIENFPAVSILKPLHGDEPALEENLESFLVQDYPAPCQYVFGVQSPDDAAIAVVERLLKRHPAADAVLVVDKARHGTNPKIANLMNMRGAIRHDVVILSDSDIAVEAGYLRRIAAALAPERVGAVTCVYTGWPAAGLVSRLSAMGVSYHFLPNVMAGLGLKMTAPCFGSTIALKGKVLREIGGLAAFADQLADDNEIGRAVRAKGYEVAIPPFAVRHAATETTWSEWLSHELRWMRTIRTVDPAGHAGSLVTHAIPLALLGLILTGLTPAAWGAFATTILARLVLKWCIDTAFGEPAGPYWLMPARDVLTFCVFVTSLFGSAVVWQKERLRVGGDGALSGR